MAGPNVSLTKTFDAGGAITIYRLLKHGAADDTLIQAVDDAASIIGAAGVTVASGARIEVDVQGLVEVEAGGTFARGDYVTAEAAGKGIKAAPAAGVNSNVAGVAMASAADGDIVSVLMAPSRIQG